MRTWSPSRRRCCAPTGSSFTYVPLVEPRSVDPVRRAVERDARVVAADALLVDEQVVGRRPADLEGGVPELHAPPELRPVDDDDARVTRAPGIRARGQLGDARDAGSLGVVGDHWKSILQQSASPEEMRCESGHYAPARPLLAAAGAEPPGSRRAGRSNDSLLDRDVPEHDLVQIGDPDPEIGRGLDVAGGPSPRRSATSGGTPRAPSRPRPSPRCPSPRGRSIRTPTRAGSRTRGACRAARRGPSA